MIKKLISAGLGISVLLGTAAAAWADPYERDRDHDRRVVEHRDFDRDHDRARHVWVRGERFIRAPGYLDVRDWWNMRLHRPPIGFHWVRAGDDFLLVNSRSGFILDVVAARF